MVSRPDEFVPCRAVFSCDVFSVYEDKDSVEKLEHRTDCDRFRRGLCHCCALPQYVVYYNLSLTIIIAVVAVVAAAAAAAATAGVVNSEQEYHR